MASRKTTKSVRLSDEAYDQAAKLAGEMKPKSTLQYIVEDALTQYLDRVQEEGAVYRINPAKGKK